MKRLITTIFIILLFGGFIYLVQNVIYGFASILKIEIIVLSSTVLAILVSIIKSKTTDDEKK